MFLWKMYPSHVTLPVQVSPFAHGEITFWCREDSCLNLTSTNGIQAFISCLAIACQCSHCVTKTWNSRFPQVIKEIAVLPVVLKTTSKWFLPAEKAQSNLKVRDSLRNHWGKFSDTGMSCTGHAAGSPLLSKDLPCLHPLLSKYYQNTLGISLR